MGFCLFLFVLCWDHEIDSEEPRARAHAEVFDQVLAKLHNKFIEADFFFP